MRTSGTLVRRMSLPSTPSSRYFGPSQYVYFLNNFKIFKNFLKPSIHAGNRSYGQSWPQFRTCRLSSTSRLVKRLSTPQLRALLSGEIVTGHPSTAQCSGRVGRILWTVICLEIFFRNIFGTLKSTCKARTGHCSTWATWKCQFASSRTSTPSLVICAD